MSIFSKKVWKDFVAEYPNRRKIKNVATQEEQVVEVQLDVGTIQENGDKWAMTPMNDLEDRIDQAFSDVEGTVSYYADNAAASADEAASSSISARNRQYEAEAWAIGTKNEIPVTSEDDQYQNNAKYYAQQASSSASSASSSKNDAATYANQASNYASNAETAKNNAQTSATDAQQSNVAAGNKALIAEGFANGEQDGTPVSSDSPYYHNNAKYFKEVAEQTIGSGLATTEHPGLVKVGEGLEIESDGTLNVDFSPSDKMDKTNPRGTGSFGLNLNEEQELGDYAVSLGKGRTFIDIDFSTATVTYDSDDGNYAILNTNLVIPEIDNLVVDYIEFYVGGVANKCFSPVITDGKLRAYKYYGRDYTTLNNTPISDVKAYIPSGNVASGNYAFAVGVNAEASGYASIAMGEGSMATNRDAIAIGGSNESSGESATTIGYANKAEGYATTAIGYGNKALYNYSVAIGNANNATATAAVAIGAENTASNAYAVATGYQTTASGWASNSEGRGTVASGQCSHAEGDRSVASGANSHAEGYLTEAKGQSHAEGMNTIARGNGQHVEGVYNIEDTEEEYLHIVGNGTYEQRSNAMTVDRQGNTWTAGKFSFGTDSNVCDEHETKLVEDYWGQEPEFDDWTNYLKVAEEYGTKISGDSPITGTAVYDIGTTWAAMGFVITDSTILNELAGKTLEMGAIGYNYTFAKANKVTFRYRYSDESDFHYFHTDNVNSGSTVISDNVSGLAFRITVPDDRPINYCEFYFVSNSHSPVVTFGTLELTKAYLIDIDEYELPERDNTYVKMKRINTSTLTGLDANTLYFNKLDHKIYFTNNVSEVVAFGGGSDTPPEIAISTAEPTGDEVLWINPDDPHDTVEFKLEYCNDVNVNNPSDGNILTYNSTSQKWVNSLKIKTMTQAQYDALTTKDANTIYFVT